MARVVDTLTSVTIVVVIICAGTSAPMKTSPAPVAMSRWVETVPRTAAHHTRTTVVMNTIVSLLTLAAPPARLLANQKVVPATTHLPTSATTPTSTAGV